MLNSIFNKINISIKILIGLLLILIIFMAKSVFLITFITILILIFTILSNNSVKYYLETIKNLLIWLLFIVLMYIIIVENNISVLIFIYKIVLCITLISSFNLTASFDKLQSGIYTLLKPLNKLKFDINKFSYSFTVYVFFVKYFAKSGNKIQKSQQLKNKSKYGVKYYLMPRLFLSINEINNLESNLKLKFYEVQKEKINSNSIICLVVFMILFIVVMFKEVIL